MRAVWITGLRFLRRVSNSSAGRSTVVGVEAGVDDEDEDILVSLEGCVLKQVLFITPENTCFHVSITSVIILLTITRHNRREKGREEKLDIQWKNSLVA